MGFLDLFKRKSKDEELQPLPDFEEIESVDKDDDWGISHMMKDHSSEIDDFFNNLEDKEKTVLDAEDLNPPSFEKYKESVRAKETRKALGWRDDGEVSPPPLLSKKKEIDEKKKDDLFKALGNLEEDFEDR